MHFILHAMVTWWVTVCLYCLLTSSTQVLGGQYRAGGLTLLAEESRGTGGRCQGRHHFHGLVISRDSYGPPITTVTRQREQLYLTSVVSSSHSRHHGRWASVCLAIRLGGDNQENNFVPRNFEASSFVGTRKNPDDEESFLSRGCEKLRNTCWPVICRS